MARPDQQRRWKTVRALIACLGVFTATAGAAAADDASGEKRIALTFDDGPKGAGAFYSGAERTARLITALRAGGVDQAAFFITTKNLEGEMPARRVRAYARAGHVIANHSDQHSWLNRVSAGEYIADIDLAEEKLEGFGNRRAWFRFPYLDEGRALEKRDAVRAALAERELMSGYVTVDTFDWHMDRLVAQAKRADECIDLDGVGEIYVDMLVAAAEHFHDMALGAMGRAPAQVMLLHENDLAAMFADDLVRGLRAAGWQIITADEAYEDELATHLPETLFSGMGRVAAFAYEAGYRADRLDHPAADEAAIEARFDAAGVLTCEAL